jgi:Putative zinc-finger
MQCSKATRQLQLYIDKRLTLDQMRELEMHLSTCSACSNELVFLEEIDQVLHGMEMVPEPINLTSNIMKRVALSVQQAEEPSPEQQAFSFFIPSFLEFLFAIILATIAMLGIVLVQFIARGTVPMSSDHTPLLSLLISLWSLLTMFNNQTFMAVLWILGTILGVWITLIVAGADMRNEWLKAVMDRLPVR